MACSDTNDAPYPRARARVERYAYTTLFLPQKCHPRPLHSNKAARVARTSESIKYRRLCGSGYKEVLVSMFALYAGSIRV